VSRGGPLPRQSPRKGDVATARGAVIFVQVHLAAQAVDRAGLHPSEIRLTGRGKGSKRKCENLNRVVFVFLISSRPGITGQ
jgi:hypothetical protein